jgi:hypothetical protein
MPAKDKKAKSALDELRDAKKAKKRKAAINPFYDANDRRYKDYIDKLLKEFRKRNSDSNTLDLAPKKQPAKKKPAKKKGLRPGTSNPY